jgi:NCAIR mutase (PurE)-related protein
MNRDEILKLLQMVSNGEQTPESALESLANGEQTPESALESLANLPSICMDYARLDTHRRLRRGIPETIYGQDKTPGQIEGIVEKLTEAGSPVLVTRISPETAQHVQRRWPEAVTDELSRTLSIGSLPRCGGSPVMVVAAGTSDLPVAEEAVKTVAFLGREPVRAYDVGVSGLHRLAAFRDEMEEAGVIIAVASVFPPVWAMVPP